jgi:hypothetical protein
MSPKPKQIIVDKDALVGININDLCDFAQNHLMLGCDTLLYECATASKQKPREMLERYKRFIKSGGYYCSCSVTYTQNEGENSHSFAWFLPDLKATRQIRKGEVRLEDLLDSRMTGEVSQSRHKVAKAIFLDLSDKLKNRIDLENPDVGKKIKDLTSDRFERFRVLFKSIDARDLHQMCVDSFPHDWIKNERTFCLSPEWMSWQLIRLTDAIVQNYCYLRQMGGGPRDERAEHDYQDMEYVLLLSRADCLLTRDENLVKPLARAAFPDKDVFSNLDEVPDDYLCDWSKN